MIFPRLPSSRATTSWSTGHCPVNYSAPAPKIPEAEEFCARSPGAPDTVRCATGQSGAPDQGAFRDAFCSLFEPNFGLFNWLVENL